MAGHSKWNNIKRRKGAQDAKKGKIFMRHAKEIYIAAKEGGGDPEMNPTLRTAIENARDANMPKDNIERNIKKATGTLEGVSYEELTYEGYGPGGVAVIVEILTDNRNRTASEIRHAFSKHGGNLGENGSVSFMFDRKGYIVIVDEDEAVDEDELTLEAIEAGADDLTIEENVYEIFTSPEDFKEVCDYLKANDYKLAEAEVSLIPQTYTDVNEKDEEKMANLLDMLEDEEDVQDIHHNANLNRD